MISFRHPTTILISGPTQCGKTFLFKQILAHELIQPPPTRIIYVNNEKPPELAAYPNIEFVKGIKDLIAMYDGVEKRERTLIVLDDQMGEAGGTATISDLFTKGAHHQNITVVYIVQNLFDKGRFHRTISLNSHYMVIFKNPRDQGQIRSLAQQAFPSKVKFLVQAFEDATDRPYGYLLLDLHPQTPEEMRVRTKIFRNEEMEVYIPVQKGNNIDQKFLLSRDGYIKKMESAIIP